jgi:hypothetical protein
MSQQNSSQGRPGSPAGAGAGAGGTGISPIAVCAPAFAPSTGKAAHFREDFTTDFPARPAATKMNMEMTNGGWAGPERSQGNDCQGNNPNEALFHSPDRHSPDKGENSISSYLCALCVLLRQKSCWNCVIFSYSGTDRGLFRTAEVSSVKSVISAVQFILVATGRAASFLSFTSHQYPPANQAPSLKNPAKPPFWSRSNQGQSRSIKVNKGE